MPEGTRVYRCVQKLMKEGFDKVSAIRICQKTTGQAYMTGKPIKEKIKGKNRGHERL